MKHRRATRFLTGLIAVTLSCTLSLASAADALENGLAQAMHLKKGTNERVGTSGKAIQAYVQAGYLEKNRTPGWTTPITTCSKSRHLSWAMNW